MPGRWCAKSHSASRGKTCFKQENTMSDHLPADPLPIAVSRQAPNTATYYYADGRAITLHGDRPHHNTAEQSKTR
jgi:hypothetical protein